QVLGLDRQVLARDAVAPALGAVTVGAVLGEGRLAAVEDPGVDLVTGPVLGRPVLGLGVRGGSGGGLGGGDREPDQDSDQDGGDGRTTDDGGSSDGHEALPVSLGKTPPNILKPWPEA